MADQESKDFSEDIAEQNFAEQNGEAENNGENSSVAENNQESQEDRKLFVGGLSWETTDKELREHFSAYGDIESINVKTDPNTGRSRGFAFIVFAKAESLDKIMAAGDHVINNKKVDPKKAKARHGKIFVGGLSTELSDDDIKNFFSQFGTIVEVEMPFDKTKNQRKGFCFITFESEQVVNELLKTSKQTINGKEAVVSVKAGGARAVMAAVTAAATAREDTAAVMMDTADTIITVVMDTTMAVVITTVATVAGAVAHAVKEVQATVASKGVVRVRGTNPINKGNLLIYDRNAIRIVTAGIASRGFRLQSQYYNSSNHSIQYTSTSASIKKNRTRIA
ncbi:PREDICTED: RNA-binding protein squid isoform X3 [Vollenhovia emeryi]|uniref:RNA-binding protein squid isoform X3 n=1 Tax=Vollenhovia emeryi TaxID=411798 RepID=UPI0005F3AC9E|nr:PREDICTED: RNA-binding protein squid isoform X3 [Vollenhovia emeryi]